MYEEPRAIIRKATGSSPLEMEKRRRESFCCGAGGGRMWMEESSGTRINADRTRQALRRTPRSSPPAVLTALRCLKMG